MKTSFDNQFTQMETLTKSNLNNLTPTNCEEIIDKSVKRSIRSCSVVTFN